MRFKESNGLLLIVLAAVIARVFTLWVGRPELRGLLEHGSLPYSDMPLLLFEERLSYPKPRIDPAKATLII